jgi:hypothetical protein
MLGWIIQTSIFSIAIIFLVHHIINFLKSTLTVPKIKDLVHSPLQKYENIIQNMNNSPETSSGVAHDRDAMKNELKMFLKNQLKPSGTQSSGPTQHVGATDITALSEPLAAPLSGTSSLSEIESFAGYDGTSVY